MYRTDSSSHEQTNSPTPATLASGAPQAKLCRAVVPQELCGNGVSICTGSGNQQKWFTHVCSFARRKHCFQCNVWPLNILVHLQRFVLKFSVFFQPAYVFD